MPLDPVLIFAYGNDVRGDDALAPMLLDSIRQLGVSHGCGHPLKFLSDYQMQVEHIIDLQGCARVLLIDAHKSLQQAFSFYSITQKAESLYTTHGMSPASLLHTFEKVLQQKAPQTSMLAIQGAGFELGQGLSSCAEKNLLLAQNFVTSILYSDDFKRWDDALKIKHT